MPTNQSDALDDPLVADGDTTFVKGQASAHQEGSIEPGGYASAQNMDFDPFGRLVTRRGAKTALGNVETQAWGAITTTWTADTASWGTTLTAGTTVDGAFFFSTGTNQQMILAQGGQIKKGTEGATFTDVAGATYSGTFVFFAQIGTRLYYCDGAGSLAYIDSANANQSITAGKVTSIKMILQGSGYVAVPAITFSSGAATATAVLGYGGNVVASTVTAASSGYSATTPPGITFAAAPAGGVTATGRPNISQIPSKPKFLVTHTNRLFCTTADTAIPSDTIYASDFLDGESWDLVGASIRVGGDGDPITAIYSWTGTNLLVFKQRSIWMVAAEPTQTASQWTIKQLTNRIGCVSHRSVQSVGKDVFFLAQDGVRNMASIETATVTEIGQPMSFPVQDKIDAITRSNQQYVCSAYYRNRYFLSLPVETGGAAPTIQGCLVWNQLTEAWMSVWTGWQPREFVISGFSGKTRLNFADAAGKLWTWDDFTNVTAETSSQFQDDTTIYESYVITRAYDCGEDMVDKLGHTVQIFSENRMTDMPVSLYTYYDKDVLGAFTALETALSIAAGDKQKRRTYNLLPKGKWNCIQFKIGSLSGRVAVVGIKLTGFTDNIKPELSS